MKPVKFKDCNTVFAKNQPEYLTLPAQKTEDGTVITHWSFSLSEKIAVLFGVKLKVKILTFNQPLQPLKLMIK